MDCQDGDADTYDFCNVSSGACINIQNPECTYAIDPNCNDNDADTLDWCEFGTCENQEGIECFVEAHCDDGNPATIDHCYWQNHTCGYRSGDSIECSYPADPRCNDNNAATEDWCDNGQCQHSDNERGCYGSGDCNDYNESTIDMCVDYTCVNQAEDALECGYTYDPACDDSDNTTNDRCEDGACRNYNISSVQCYNNWECNDHNTSTKDMCVNSLCVHQDQEQMECTYLEDPACDDSVSTTEDWCDYGVCRHTNASSFECFKAWDCDDSDSNTVDMCVDNFCRYMNITSTECSYREDTRCNDGNALTADWCDHGSCRHQNSTLIECYGPGDCFDGLPDTIDMCIDSNCYYKTAASMECTYYSDPACGDENITTEDWCDNGKCRHTNSNLFGCYEPWDCDDGNPNTTDICNSDHACAYINESSAECNYPEDPRCNDADATTLDWCEYGICRYSNASTIKCYSPADCYDGDTSTMDMCIDYECAYESMGSMECTFNQDPACDDSDSDTEDWCEYGRCRHTDSNNFGCFKAWDCDDGNPNTTDICNRNHECAYINITQSECTFREDPACGDGDDTTEDWCDYGFCRHSNTSAVGCYGPADCYDGNTSTMDMCIDYECVYEAYDSMGCHYPEDPICDDSVSTTEDWCDNGRCRHTNSSNFGCFGFQDCFDGNESTIDICNRDHECVYKPISAMECSYPEDPACSDGDTSTDDWCDFGKCRHTAMSMIKCFGPADCYDGNPITMDMCADQECVYTNMSAMECTFPTDPACDDADSDTEDWCDYGRCRNTNATNFECFGFADCNDGNTSTFDICNEYHKCAYESTGSVECRYPHDRACDDSNSSTEDWCEAGRCRHSDTSKIGCYGPADCYDGNTSTMDMCIDSECTYEDMGNMGCHYPEDPACDDSDNTTEDWCDRGRCRNTNATNFECFGPWDCNDQNPDTMDICNEYHECVYESLGAMECYYPNDPACDDSVSTTEDWCDYGKCRNSNATMIGCFGPADCFDGDSSTIDMCIDRECAYTATSGMECFFDGDPACGDGDATTEDWCENGRCRHTNKSSYGCLAPWDCFDGNPSTIDICNEYHECVYETEGDLECLYPMDPACGDGDATTEDWCDYGKCRHTNQTYFECFMDWDCEDFNTSTVDFCVDQVCVYKNTTSLGCTYRMDPVCDDSNSSTYDICERGTCRNSPATSVECYMDFECNDFNSSTKDICAEHKCRYKTRAIMECYNDFGCDDSDATTDNFCKQGKCRYVNNTFIECKHDLQCDDANNATRDTCVDGECNYGSINDVECLHDLNCTDGDAGTDDACVSGVCRHFPAANVQCYDNIDCNDGNESTTDMCDGFQCVFADVTKVECNMTTISGNLACDDSNSTTLDVCVKGKCVNQPNSEFECFNHTECYDIATDTRGWCIDHVCAHRDFNFTIGSFSGNETTNFSQAADLRKVTNVTFVEVEDDTYLGTMEYGNRSINMIEMLSMLASQMNIGSNNISVNSSALRDLNNSAALGIYGLAFENPQVLMDGELCPSTICTYGPYVGGKLSFNVTQFSDYTVRETPEDDDDGGGGGGGGGGSGATTGGVATSESAKKEKIAPGKKTSFAFPEEITPVISISLKPTITLKSVMLTVKTLNTRPKSVSFSPTGKLYKYIKLTETNISSADVEGITIYFQINKKWLKGNKLDTDEIVLARWSEEETGKAPSATGFVTCNNFECAEITESSDSGWHEFGKWTELPTSSIGQSTDYERFKSTSPGLSYYVIKSAVGDVEKVVEKEPPKIVTEAPPEEEESSEEGEKPEVIEEAETIGEAIQPVEGVPYLNWLAIVFILAIISGAAYHYTHR